MARHYRFFWTAIIVIAVCMGFVSCKTYRPVDVTNTMAAQINNLELYEPGPGENVKTLLINRTGSFVRDLNAYQNGTWYSVHQNRIVSIEAVVKVNRTFIIGKFIKPKDQWRVEYVPL